MDMIGQKGSKTYKFLLTCSLDFSPQTCLPFDRVMPRCLEVIEAEAPHESVMSTARDPTVSLLVVGGWGRLVRCGVISGAALFIPVKLTLS